MKTVELKGFGGTDFRPVFSYVDMLIFRHISLIITQHLYFKNENIGFDDPFADLVL